MSRTPSNELARVCGIKKEKKRLAVYLLAAKRFSLKTFALVI